MKKVCPVNSSQIFITDVILFEIRITNFAQNALQRRELALLRIFMYYLLIGCFSVYTSIRQ